MSSIMPKVVLEVEYFAAAQDYLHSLPPEHFMEATSQSTQRKITLESFDLIHAQWPEFQAFSELLLQYPLKGQKKLGQVVPDNMVVLSNEKIDAEGSYDLPLQPAKPYFILEYVSKSNRRKDYTDNIRRYEQELKIPYFLLFELDKQIMRLHRFTAGKYVVVKPNKEGRVKIRKLKLEMGLLEGWVRFWYRGKLLPLPGDLLKSLKRMTNKYRQAKKMLEANAEQMKAMAEEIARLKALQRNGKHEKP